MTTTKIFNYLTNQVLEVKGEILSQNDRLLLINTDENKELDAYGTKYIIVDIKAGRILCCASDLSDLSKVFNNYKKTYDIFIKTKAYKKMCERSLGNV